MNLSRPVYDPDTGKVEYRVTNPDAIPDDALPPEEQREDDLSQARKVLASLKGAAVEVPSLSGLIEPLNARIERADSYHLAADDARREAAAAKATRDAHETAALADANGDPVSSAAEAQRALDDAEKRAQDAERLADTAVKLALNDAQRTKRQIRREYQANAPRLTRERLRSFEEERKAAVEAVAEAKRRIHRVVSRYMAVRGIATRLPEDDRLRELVSRSRFAPQSRRVGTNQPTLDGVLMYMDSIPERLGYGVYNPHAAYPVVGNYFGEAVRIATEEDAAAEDED